MWKVGKGDRICFWKDEWVGEGRLKDQFLRIFAIASSKNMVVEEAYLADSRSKWWNVNVIGNRNDWKIEEYEALLLLLSHIKLDDRRDQLTWKLRKQGDYFVKTLYKHLTRGDGSGTAQFPVKRIWQMKAPPRNAFFAWVASRK